MSISWVRVRACAALTALSLYSSAQPSSATSHTAENGPDAPRHCRHRIKAASFALYWGRSASRYPPEVDERVSLEGVRLRSNGGEAGRDGERYSGHAAGVMVWRMRRLAFRAPCRPCCRATPVQM
jgi:hypothetical protein